ncbi:MAG: T9SS type A sorting domain-containing protein [Candidatus Oleimicrobiaceae bacterium]
MYLARISDSGEILWGPTRISTIPTAQFMQFLDSNLNLNLYEYYSIRDKFLRVNAETGEIMTEKEIGIGARGSQLSGTFDYCFSDSFSATFAFQVAHWDTLRMQKLGENGNKLWGDEPVIIDHGNGSYYLSFDVESDQNGGVYIIYSNPLVRETVHLVHLDRQGRRLWDQTFYSPGGVYGHGNEMISVGSDGSVFVLTHDIKYVTKLRFEGQILWRTMVTSRDTVAYESWHSGLIADTLGGCIVIWREIGPDFWGFMAQRVDKNGNLGGPTSVRSYRCQISSHNNEITSFYPNPINDAVTIRFAIKNSQQVTLKVINMVGKEVVTLKSGNVARGDHAINWRGTDASGQALASGVYLLVLQTGSTRVSQKLLILR